MGRLPPEAREMVRLRTLADRALKADPTGADAAIAEDIGASEALVRRQ